VSRSGAGGQMGLLPDQQHIPGCACSLARGSRF
jgi:hypothetical protein